jgi:ketosteroid isomerase-like protein
MTKAVEKQLIELERSYWQALKDNDVAVVARLTADPCIVTGPQGIGDLSRKSMIEMMKNANYTLDAFELDDDMKVRMLDDDVAVIAYQVHEEFTVDGKPVTLDAAESSTWVRRDGSWVCALHTESLKGDPFGRDRNGKQASRSS